MDNEMKRALLSTLTESRELLQLTDAAILFHSKNQNYVRVRQLQGIKNSLMEFAKVVLENELESKQTNVININGGSIQ